MQLEHMRHWCTRTSLIVAIWSIAILLGGCSGSTSSSKSLPPSDLTSSSKSLPPSDLTSSSKSLPPGDLTSSSEPAPPIGAPHLANPGDGGVMPSRLEIPVIDLDIPVVELGWHAAEDGEGEIFSEWDVADNAAGWHKNSALLGEGGNIVLSGHNNIRGAVFRDLDRLKKGDEVVLWSGRRTTRYSIEQVLIVPEKYASPEQRAQNIAWIGPFDDDRLTMVSCWPRNDNSHRIIVVAHPVESTAQR